MDSPNLRNSHEKGYSCTLRRTDKALHEATQRFVESYYGDKMKISQYSDLENVCKRVTSDKWIILHPLPGKAFVGYLVFLPRQPIVWIDEQFKYSYKIHMRVSFQIYERKSIFIASLDRNDGMLRIEDCWLKSGVDFRDKLFSQRWESLLHFFDSNYKPDPVLSQGLRIEPAVYEPLNSVHTWKEKPSVIFAQSETSPRRLRVYFKETTNTISHPKPAVQVPPRVFNSTPAERELEVEALGKGVGLKTLVPPKPMKEKPVKEVPSNTVKEESDSSAIATPHETFPDTYNLIMKGVKKGFAAVQDLTLSKKLRTAFQGKKELPVKVSWNEEFKMYEIEDLML